MEDLATIKGNTFYRMAINAANKLEEQKEYVNSLNVFPVPDGDTGTNMAATLKNAVSEINGKRDSDICEVSRLLSKGALMGARGNSGVILSQILRGIARGLEGKIEATSEDFAKALVEGSFSAYKAVMRPTEGTILTIIRAASESAMKYKDKGFVKLFSNVIKSSEDTLAKTPDLNPVLKKAKVIDSGGLGLVIILKAMFAVISDDIMDVEFKGDDDAHAEHYVQEDIDHFDIKYGYCTEFIILSNSNSVNEFKSELEKIGDSMVVVDMDDLIKVHIHTNDPGLVLSKALKLGELSRIKIDNMREEHRHVLNIQKEDALAEASYGSKDLAKENQKYGFISVAKGDGLLDIFKDLGCSIVVEGGQTMNPSTEDILNAVNAVNADYIIVLPNNKNVIMAAKQVLDLTDKNVTIIETSSIPQGITALTVVNEELSLEENIETINEAISNTKSASITYAIRDTKIDDIEIKNGDILGLIEDKIDYVGEDYFEALNILISKMIDDNSEFITIIYGNGLDGEDVNAHTDEIEENYPDVDIQVLKGDQPLYYFILAVE
ncbi:MAG: DAK2 domain-containing protein [Oscillospiraceae bacterium]|nr:DAK2 domain-containing protein [Oscillospiraceae bacterium]